MRAPTPISENATGPMQQAEATSAAPTPPIAAFISTPSVSPRPPGRPRRVCLPTCDYTARGIHQASGGIPAARSNGHRDRPACVGAALGPRDTGWHHDDDRDEAAHESLRG